MDAYSGYNQKHMVEGDAQHTTFYVDIDIYYYMVMPLGLNNASVTSQRMVNKLFTGMKSVTMEAYVGDMLVKSVKGVNHVEDLRQTFEHIRLHQVCLNPAKCAFGVQSGKILGYMVRPRGIELNPEKLEAIKGMKSLTFHREVQSLNGRLASLIRFLENSETSHSPSSKC